tara:strand:+ start:17512 stop:18183 length:672 start_codon:yes stop_codon:yes gene_type:complete
MRLYLIRIFIIIIIFFFNAAQAKDFDIFYNVSTSGIKIGKFNWSLKIEGSKYKTEINLKNSGIFSPLYKFEGNYISEGIIQNNKFEAQEYKQYWKTKKKLKVVEMSFDNYLIKLTQDPIEKEHSRVSLYELSKYFDPITSFINILKGHKTAKTIDGRRIYIMKRIILNNTKKIVLEISDYKNIWADHKRNDLKKIEFIINEIDFLPEKINIHFKDRIFKLRKS